MQLKQKVNENEKNNNRFDETTGAVINYDERQAYLQGYEIFQVNILGSDFSSKYFGV